MAIFCERLQLYVRGKLVTIDIDQGNADYWTYPKLSDDLRAKSPKAVETVALVKWEWEGLGEYREVETGRYSGKAKRSIATVTLVDWVEQVIIDEATFAGDAPPKATTLEGDYAYERPMFEIVSYLESLPRQ